MDDKYRQRPQGDPSTKAFTIQELLWAHIKVFGKPPRMSHLWGFMIGFGLSLLTAPSIILGPTPFSLFLRCVGLALMLLTLISAEVLRKHLPWGGKHAWPIGLLVGHLFGYLFMGSQFLAGVML